MENFTPVSALLGGFLIGLAAAVLFLANGRIAGISGILGNLLSPTKNDVAWRVVFLLGLVMGTMLWRVVDPSDQGIAVTASVPTLIIGGLLVGLGTRIGGGCTSGHGVCGIARLSRRSITATAAFMGSAMITVYLARHVLGG